MNTPIESSEFVKLIEAHRDEFYRYVKRMLWEPGAADDVFSSAVLSAYENLPRFEPGTNFRAWVFRILTNKCFVANRETARAPQPLDDSFDETWAAVQEGPDYTEMLDEPMRVLDACGGEVYNAFRLLSAAERSCLLLKAIESFSYKEIAEILDMPEGTVMTHLARGRAKLRKELLDYARERGILGRASNRTEDKPEGGI